MTPLFVVLSILLVIAILFAIIFPKWYKKYRQKNYHKIYGKNIYKIALNEDYYLINDLNLKVSSKQTIKIDHLLFGNKFVYVINDLFLLGEIRAKESDRSWVYKPLDKKTKSRYLDNQIIEGRQRLKVLSKVLPLNETYLISICVINNDLVINDFKQGIDQSKITKIKNLKSLILEYESRDIGLLDEAALDGAVQYISKKSVKEEKNEELH